MNFNKQMIDLVREIRRRAPSEYKPGIKLANPELLTEMIPWFHASKDAVTKALIKELFEQAEGDWSEKLLDNKIDEPSGPSGKVYVTKVYRGQVQLVEVASDDGGEPGAPKRMYRGQIVR